MEKIAIFSALAGLLATGINSFLRRPKKTSQGGAFLTRSELLAPPMFRPAYSDRMAYVLAEMSALAYFKFESEEEGALQKMVDKFQQLKGSDDNLLDEKVRELLVELQEDLMFNRISGKETLGKILNKVDFQLLDTINIKSTQGFVCKRAKTGEASYLVIAFRGTENALEDWLTDASAVPASDLPSGIKVHKGFWDALNKEPNAENTSVLKRITEILAGNDAQDGEKKLPCFFTGHSLGGALALITTRQIAPDICGACYTFGAPRVANYEYFATMKTPVFRVVNSADIVPRVPPGAGMAILLKLVQGLGWVTQFIPGSAEPLDWLEKKVDQLNGYRHHGDLRYLTDIKSGQFEDVRLLNNPPMIDRIWWMWQHVRKSFMEPVKSHGMAIYRLKLQQIASRRNV